MKQVDQVWDSCAAVLDGDGDAALGSVDCFDVSLTANESLSLFVQGIVGAVIGAMESDLHDVTANLRFERLRRATGDDLPVIDDGNAATEAVGLLHCPPLPGS